MGELQGNYLDTAEDLGPAPIDQPDAPRAPLVPPKLKPEASGKITITEICDCLMNEASRIAVAQMALVDMGWRQAPDPKQKRRELLFVAAADMLARLEPHQEEIRRMMSADKPKKKTR